MKELPFTSNIIADIGISLGDEGKGRLVEKLIEDLQRTTGEDSPVGMVFKVNGGAASGHAFDGMKLNLLPAGIDSPSVSCIGIGMGVVADPRQFLWEILPLEKKGLAVLDRLLIDERTQLCDFSHRLLDLAWDDYRTIELSGKPRDAAEWGISSAYEAETQQFQMFYRLFRGGKVTFAEMFKERIERTMRIIQHVCHIEPNRWDSYFEILSEVERRENSAAIEAGILKEEEFDFERFKGTRPFKLKIQELTDVYWESGLRLASNIEDIRERIRKEQANGKYVIAEFKQSYWLDKRQGFVPDVMPYHTTPSEIFSSAGIPVQNIHTLGVCKAYDSKSENHHLITKMEEDHPLAERLRKAEFKASTRLRTEVGWFDAVEKGDALRYAGFQDLVITKLDLLSFGSDWKSGELKICTHYIAPDGSEVMHVPREESYRRKLKPYYRRLSGWKMDLSEIRTFDELPTQARRYIAILVKSVMAIAYQGSAFPETMPNLRYIGVGPNRDQVIRDLPETRVLMLLA